MPDKLLNNRLKSQREARGWSQEELANRSGVSRTGISAIEGDRLVPSTAAALRLAAALDCRVEQLFQLARPLDAEPAWAFTPTRDPCRYWRAEVDGREWLYPAQHVSGVQTWHDGVYRNGRRVEHADIDPRNALVIAGCDPAAGLLASHYERRTDFRLIVLPRSSSESISLLEQGIVHAAGVHLGTAAASRNMEIVQQRLGGRFCLLRMARWEEGVTTSRRIGATTLDSLLESRLRWIGREPESGARHCLEELFGDRPVPRKQARDHRGVVDAIRCGWADAGVCVRLVSEEPACRFCPSAPSSMISACPRHRSMIPGCWG
ncbi:MAG: substrate-binding domain-containing protein [Pirellulales bacterium]